MLPLTPSAPEHWLVAAVPPLVILGVGQMWSLAADGRHRTRGSAGIDVDREACNIAAMATRDYYAATQDSNALMGLVHVTSAGSLLAAARRVATDEQLSLGLNSDVRTVASDIEELQRTITKRLSSKRRRKSSQ